MKPVEDSNTVASEPNDDREQLKADVRREHDMYLRALADFENYRRRVERDRARRPQAAKREILLSLLDVLDGFDRALPYMSGSHLNPSPRACRQSTAGYSTCSKRKDVTPLTDRGRGV